MLIEKDLSELNDKQKLGLVDSYLKDLADMYAALAKELDDKGGSVSKSFAEQLIGKEQDVLRLRTWVSIIIAQYIERKLASEMSQALGSQSPPVGDYELLKRAEEPVEELRKRWTRNPPLRAEHLPMVEATQGLLEAMKITVGGIGQGSR